MKAPRPIGRVSADAALKLFNAGRVAEAGDMCRHLLRKLPRDHNCLLLLGGVELQSGRPAEALEVLDRALAVQPSAQVQDLRGDALLALGREAEAQGAWREAIRLDPNMVRPFVSLAGLLRLEGRAEESLQLQQHALRLRPGDPVVLHGIGLAQIALGRYQEGERSLRAALLNGPNIPLIRSNLGSFLIATERLRDGLEYYESRSIEFGDRRRISETGWRGEDLNGRTLLVVADEGLGDFIQGCRYIPSAALQGTVIAMVPPPLTRLAARIPGVSQVVPLDGGIPQADFHCSAFSLWRAFNATLGMFGGAVPYLTPDPADAARWRDRLRGLPGPRVGLVWAGNPNIPADRLRSIPFPLMAPILDQPGVSFISLQKGRDAAAAPLADWTAELTDVAETAALIAGLDLVITVDSMIAHLTGALGRPVWMMNRWDGTTDARWFMRREDTPLYPTMRIFRQTTPLDWPEVIGRVAVALGEWVNSSPR